MTRQSGIKDGCGCRRRENNTGTPSDARSKAASGTSSRKRNFEDFLSTSTTETPPTSTDSSTGENEVSMESRKRARELEWKIFGRVIELMAEQVQCNVGNIEPDGLSPRALSNVHEQTNKEFPAANRITVMKLTRYFLKSHKVFTVVNWLLEVGVQFGPEKCFKRSEACDKALEAYKGCKFVQDLMAFGCTFWDSVQNLLVYFPRYKKFGAPTKKLSSSLVNMKRSREARDFDAEIIAQLKDDFAAEIIARLKGDFDAVFDAEMAKLMAELKGDIAAEMAQLKRALETTKDERLTKDQNGK